MAAYVGDGLYRCPNPECSEPVKPRSEFYVTKSKRTGISHYCKVCARAKQKRNRELTARY